MTTDTDLIPLGTIVRAPRTSRSHRLETVEVTTHIGDGLAVGWLVTQRWNGTRRGTVTVSLDNPRVEVLAPNLAEWAQADR